MGIIKSVRKGQSVFIDRRELCLKLVRSLRNLGRSVQVKLVFFAGLIQDVYQYHQEISQEHASLITPKQGNFTSLI